MNLFHEAKQVLDKDGKVNPLGPYGKQKLTGREVTTYFRRNKVADAMVKKAVEVALDLGGAMDIASKEIKKFYGDKILKSKEVQTALKYANEEVVSEEPFNANAALKKQRVASMRDKLENLRTQRQRADDSARQAREQGRDDAADGHEEKGDRIDSNIRDLKAKIRDEIGEETISENYRELAKHGMGTETPKSIKVGTEIDYYQKDGAKYMGKVIKVSKQSYTVRDDKTKKTHEFSYHDRNKAKKLLQKKDKLSNIIKKNTIKKGKFAGYMTDSVQEKVEYAEYKFRNKRDAQKALDYFKSQQLIKLDINDDGLSQGELAIDANKKDMTKQHKEVLKNFKPKVLTTELKEAKAGTVMDSYRQMWEDGEKYAPSIEENIERGIMKKMRRGKVAKGMPR